MYTKEDAADARHGTIIYEGTDVEIVTYRTGNRLCIIVNKAGICAYRATLVNAFAPGTPSTTPPYNPDQDTFVIRFRRAD